MIEGGEDIKEGTLGKVVRLSGGYLHVKWDDDSTEQADVPQASIENLEACLCSINICLFCSWLKSSNCM